MTTQKIIKIETIIFIILIILVFIAGYLIVYNDVMKNQECKKGCKETYNAGYEISGGTCYCIGKLLPKEDRE